MNASNFNFCGRYTLRAMENNWYIYDRKKTTIIKDTHEHTFTKAQRKLIEFKTRMNDLTTREWIYYEKHLY